jgi:hypothetical protein
MMNQNINIAFDGAELMHILDYFLGKDKLT